MNDNRRQFMFGLGSLATVLGVPVGNEYADNTPRGAVTVITGVEQFDGITRYYRSQIWVARGRLCSREIDAVDVDDAFEYDDEESSSESETSTEPITEYDDDDESESSFSSEPPFSSEPSYPSSGGGTGYWRVLPKKPDTSLSLLSKPMPGRRIEDIPE